jgi:hypothetical protein
VCAVVLACVPMSCRKNQIVHTATHRAHKGKQPQVSFEIAPHISLPHAHESGALL